MIVVCPVTSPRGEGVPDDLEGAYDFGLGAGFYVNATVEPFAKNYRMLAYITNELPAPIAANFPVDMARQSIFGHSMGGHVALTIAFRNPGKYRSVSAFAPISLPMHCAWGQKALTGHIGTDRAACRSYVACAIIARSDAHTYE